jgi:hypothetical protein
MAIKGKTKSRSRRVVAVAPKPPVYVRKPPIWRRPVAWILIVLLVLGGTTIGVLIALSHKHERELKAQTLAAVNSFESVLDAKFPPSPDSRPSQPTGYIVYPTLATDLADVQSGKLKADDAAKKGESLAKSAKASGDAIQALNVTKLIPENAPYGEVASVHGDGATRIEMTGAITLITHAFRVYASIGSLMKQAAQTTDKAERDAIIAEAKDLLTQAQGMFNEGYQKITNVKGQLETIQPNPFPPAPGGGLGG